MPAEIQKLRPMPNPVAVSPVQLQQDLAVMKDYLIMCVRKEDWHGVMDASVDIREIVAKLSILA